MMRALRSLILAAALAACATPQTAQADPLDGADPAVLGACARAAGVSRDALNQCRGVLARTCVEANGPSSMSDVLCWSAEADAWRTLLTSASLRLNERETARDPARLTAANEAWSAWLDAECDYWAWEEGGGSGEQVDRVRCAARVTADRAIDLLIASQR